MVLQGIQLLPITVKKEHALKLFKILADANKKLGILSSDLGNSIANENLMQVFSLIETTRIESTQVTFTKILEEKGNKRSS